MARPSDYNQDIADIICDRMLCGNDGEPESLRSICRSDEMPALGTVMRWLSKHEEFQEQYTRTRELQAELQHEDIIEISDDCTDDVEVLTTQEGITKRINHSAIARAKVRIDTRKWIMERMAAKKYGAKQDVKLVVHKAPLKEEDEALLDAYLAPK